MFELYDTCPNIERGDTVSYTVEVCCYTVDDVRRAKQAGATRIELCADRSAGGTTPSYGLIEHIQAASPMDVAVMIRPRGGDFVYSEDELAIMQRDIAVAGKLGVEGVVFGVLNEYSDLDVPKMQLLVDAAKAAGLAVACHRAFDRARDPYGTIKKLLSLGIDRLLTSGQKPTAMEGLPLLRELLTIAGDELTIMAGGGVRGGNIETILAAGIRHVHTGSTEVIKSGMTIRRPELSIGSSTCDESVQTVINEEDVACIVTAVKRKTTIIFPI